MTHSVADDEVIERAALYALGTLSQHEARAFEEHLAEGCDVCWRETDAFKKVVVSIGESAKPQEPSPRVRSELLNRLKEETRLSANETRLPDVEPGLMSIARSQGEWITARAGVLVKQLFVDEATGISTSLVRMLPGTHLPRHRHTGVEQFLVLEGDCNVHGEVLGPGDFHRAEAGTIHESTYTQNGTLFLLIAPPNYDVLET
ncbi:MAG TPA: cupin domain-containing protein [Blastocatellia bacterium]|nr:cupin domain-containing protein [Blastocatellia bacterium]